MTFRGSLLDIYLYCGILIFTLGKVVDSFFLDFYLFFNILGIFVLIYYLSNSSSFQLRFKNLFIVGFLLYLVGNLVFIQDINLYFLNLSDLFFLSQVAIKQYSVTSIDRGLNFIDRLRIIFGLNILVILIAVVLTYYLETLMVDLFYFVESLISLILIIYYNFCTHNIISKINFIDIEFLFIAQALWFIGDIFYSDLILNNSYSIGDFSDLIYFFGFYFFLKSITPLKLNFNFNIVKTYI